MNVSYPAGWPLFHEYEEEIKTKNRFFLSSKFERLFCSIVSNESNTAVLSPDTPLYRARINKPNEEFEYVHELRGNKNAPSANRASPIGIPYTYLAGDTKTALAEIRANVRQPITVAEFHMGANKKIITLDGSAVYSGSKDAEFDSLEICSFILYLGLAFSAPINVGESRDLAYLPCQYFAEFCKKYGFSGIRYPSAARGNSPDEDYYNYVIFNDDDLVFKEAKIYTITNIEHTIHYDGASHLKEEDEK